MSGCVEDGSEPPVAFTFGGVSMAVSFEDGGVRFGEQRMLAIEGTW